MIFQEQEANRDPKEFPGIYRFDGDRLTIAYRQDGPAPEKFESTPGSGVTLLELKRGETVAPAQAVPPPDDSKLKSDPSEKTVGKPAEKLETTASPVSVTVVQPQFREFSPYDDLTGRIEAGNTTETGKSVSADDKKQSGMSYSPDNMYVAFDVPENTVLKIRRIIQRRIIQDEIGKAKSPASAIAVPAGEGSNKESPPDNRPKDDGHSQGWYPQIVFRLIDSKDFPFRGKVESIDVAINSETGTAHWRATLPNSDKSLLPGLFVYVRLETSSPFRACMIPQSALHVDHDKPFVYVVNDQNIVENRPVKIGQRDGETMVIDEGLTEKDRVIVSHQPDLHPGMIVTPLELNRGEPKPATEMVP
jgi:RND family efflux transporter MFP subunit